MTWFDRLLPVGRRSLLWGAHQFVWHPMTVAFAWWRLYGRPSWRELVCIAIHDVGYWQATDIDGPTGMSHPEAGATLAARWFGPTYGDLVRLHSRTYARACGRTPSRLCWADKLSFGLERWWTYLPRVYLSGELAEFRQHADTSIPRTASHRTWFNRVQRHCVNAARTQGVAPTPRSSEPAA